MRACHFSAMYAILMTRHCAVKRWNYRKVDLCLENGKRIYEGLTDASNVAKREIRDCLVADLLYNVAIVTAEVLSTTIRQRRRPLRQALEVFFLTGQSVIVQFANLSFALHKDPHDRLLHIFDSYPAEDVTLRAQDDTIKSLEPEENTASWILCAGLDAVVEYFKNKTLGLADYNLYRVKIVGTKKACKVSQLQYLLYKSCDTENKWLCGVSVEDKLENEEIAFVEAIKRPPWSRLNAFNLQKQQRRGTTAMWRDYDIEIDKELYSLWGNLSPESTVFRQPGKQYLAIYIVACGMTNLYHLDHWNAELIDSIVIDGNQYFELLIGDLSASYELKIEDFNSNFNYASLGMLAASITPVVSGILYDTNSEDFNLSRALTYFFRQHRRGILLLTGRALLIGKEQAFYMMDCQSQGSPLFKSGQGAPYVLRCCSLRRLMECILIALNVRRHCIKFAIYSVEIQIADPDTESLVEKVVQLDESLNKEHEEKEEEPVVEEETVLEEEPVVEETVVVQEDVMQPDVENTETEHTSESEIETQNLAVSDTVEE